MHKYVNRLALASSIVAAVVVGTAQAKDEDQKIVPKNRVLARALDIETGKQAPRKGEQKLSSGALYAVLAASGDLGARADKASAKEDKPPKAHRGDTVGCANTYKHGDNENIRVNQDCSLRRQAESVIAINPIDPDNLIAGQNDSRVGFNKCGYAFTFDGGKTWGDMVPPFYQFLNSDFTTFDACSDPTATFDADGNAYVGGVMFMIAYADSAFVVAKSNAEIGGAFYHTPVPGSFQEYQVTPLGVVANDNNPNIFHDKEFIVADAGKTSPKKNNVYATWTRFDLNTGAGVGAHSPIYFSQSTDGGATWSPGIEISGVNAAVCTDFSGEANPKACDQDQGSHPIVGPDGTVYVAFGNGNTPTLGLNQHLMVKCPKTADCSNPASWAAPTKIGDDIGTQPFGPDAATGCPAGRQCLPPNGYRMDDFVEGSIAVDSSGTLYSAWADFRNGGANCNPLGPAATAIPPCDNDVFYAYSTNGGATWSPTVNITPAAKIGKSAQWMPWSAVSPDGKKYYVAYYDRSYGNCETTGCNDITLATIEKAATGSPKINYTRVTTSSMPNLVVANNPIQAGFLGDYMWVAVDAKGQPYIVWSDTRGQDGAIEEDIYFAKPNQKKDD
jgi:hypothetical protein